MSENENLIDENQAQEVAQAAETTLPQTPKAPKTAHDDFDWSINKRNHVEYEADVTKKYLEEYENTLTSIKDNEIVKGIVKLIQRRGCRIGYQL